MKQSQLCYNQASHVLVGGVNSPVRAFKAVGGTPVFFESGKGALLYDVDGNSYIDYVLSWGPLILGHAYPDVIDFVKKTVEKGLSFGAPSPLETELAILIQSFFPKMEKIRFVNSGTEAVMSAVRLARGVTGRSKLVKFSGCYHGHYDPLLVSAGSGALTHGCPDSDGVLASSVSETLVLDYQDMEQVRGVFEKYGDNIAAVIIEPIAGNMGVIVPDESFIRLLREQCDSYGALLIFDEVMTGFRVGLHGAQGYFDVYPDITVLGKVVGGGMPCAAYGASAKIMSHISPEGAVYQAGTLSGNPVAMAAGIATLTVLKNTSLFLDAVESTTLLKDEFLSIIRSKGIDATIQGAGTMFTLFFHQGPVRCLGDASACDLDLFKKYFNFCLAQGIYLPPSQYETQFVSVCHDRLMIEKTIEMFHRFINEGMT